MASVMGIGGGLGGPKTEKGGFSLVLIVFFEGSRAPRVRQHREQVSGPDRPGGGKSDTFD